MPADVCAHKKLWPLHDKAWFPDLEVLKILDYISYQVFFQPCQYRLPLAH